MRLYKITAEVDVSEDGSKFETNTTWLGTQGECALRRKALKDLGVRQKDIATIEVDVPTDKAGLLAFLNAREAA